MSGKNILAITVCLGLLWYESKNAVFVAKSENVLNQEFEETMDRIHTGFNSAKDFHDPNQLFADGGVLGRNPSKYGGTIAYRWILDGKVMTEDCGYILSGPDLPEVTNNQTELLAVIRGMKVLPSDWKGTIWSDSKVTLGRIFLGWAFTNVPRWMINALEVQKSRLMYWSQIHYGLVDGHPTPSQLSAGIGKRGGLVSVHNKWCDEACSKLALVFFREMHEKLQVRMEQKSLDLHRGR